jgi:hypothetical protein
MAVAVIAFARLWYVTHKNPEPEAAPAAPPRPGMAVDVASPACATLDRALDALVRNPTDAGALDEARRKLEACAQPTDRACELGPALDARAPLTAPPSPARELLGALCQRCPVRTNPCAGLVSRALGEGLPGRTLSPAEARWNLEHAGPGLPAACASLVREALAPAAMTEGDVKPGHPALLTELAPVCAKAGHLPVAMVNAALVQRGAQAGGLAALAVAGPTYIKPSRVTGVEGGQQAFDESEKKGVELSAAASAHREDEGALFAWFEPRLRQLTGLRIMAKGPGSVRAIIPAPRGVGLKDEQRDQFFVNPTVCQFQGTGQWELCALGVPLLEVEALAVFASAPKITVYELDAQGTR